MAWEMLARPWNGHPAANAGASIGIDIGACGAGSRSRPGAGAGSGQFSRCVFFGTCALLFIASAAATVAGSASMSAMGGTPMPGGWTLSMGWTRMCGVTWPGAAAAFLGMWYVMMAAMMLPALAPALWRLRQALAWDGAAGPGRLAALAGAAYFSVWCSAGLAVFALGSALVALELRLPVLARAAPLAAGAVVLFAGAFQFSAWKAAQLARCREAPGHRRGLPADARAAWRHGLRLGLHCAHGCAGLMAALLATGLMDLRAMAVVTAAITAERLAPAGTCVARGIGAAALAVGLILMSRAAGLPA